MTHTLIVRMLIAMTFALMAVGINSCKPPATEPAATIKSEGGGRIVCTDCSLECHRAASNQAVGDQIACLSSIIDAVGPGWLQVIAGANGFAQLIAQEAFEFEEDPAAQSPSPGPSPGPATGPAPQQAGPAAQPQSAPSDGPVAQPPQDAPAQDFQSEDGFSLADGPIVSLSGWQAVNLMLEHVTSGRRIQPRWLERCASGLTGISSSLQSMATSLASLSSSQSLSASTVNDLVTAVGNGVQASLRLAQVLTNCLPGNSVKGAAQLNTFVRSFGSTLQSLSRSLGSIAAIATCTVNITRGAIELTNNTACLIEDLQKLKESAASLQRMRENILPINGPAVHPCVRAGTCPNGPPTSPEAQPASPAAPQQPAQRMCYNEPIGCSNWAMGVWGEELRRRYAGTFTRRSTFCAQMCGNRGSGGGECSAAASRMFGEGGAACNDVCRTSQCRSAVERCVSYCCSQDGSCATTAHSTMRSNGWD